MGCHLCSGGVTGAGRGGKNPHFYKHCNYSLPGIMWACWVSAKGKFLPLKGPIKNTTTCQQTLTNAIPLLNPSSGKFVGRGARTGKEEA